MAQKKKRSKKTGSANTGWLQVIESDAPRFSCPMTEEILTGPCSLRACPLWTPNTKVYSCVGAFGGMKSANSEERLQASSSAQRDKRGTLRSAADGKLSFYDMSYMYSFSRQRIEGFVSIGRQIVETLAPLFANIDVSGTTKKVASRRLGSPTLFTYTESSSHVDEETGDITRVCVCCEEIIEPDDHELVLAILDRQEVSWCSRECAKELPIDGYLVSNRYKRHYSSVALEKDPVDERSRVREITVERMAALKKLAVEHGF